VGVTVTLPDRSSDVSVSPYVHGKVLTPHPQVGHPRHPRRATSASLAALTTVMAPEPLAAAAVTLRAEALRRAAADGRGRARVEAWRGAACGAW
jgi:hypothetical protein